MNQRMTQISDRAKGFMEGFTPGQRSVVVVAAIGLLMGAFALSHWVSQPTWTVLYGDLSGEDASAVVEQLNADGVKYKLSNGGTTVLVPQDQVYDQRVALAGKGLTGGDGEDGWALLDKQGITATDFQQNIAYQRAIQGELSKTLEAMDGVDTAVVNLAVPKKDVFSSEMDKPTASVLLSLKPGTDLTNEQIQSVTHLVAGSVASLDPDDVTVTDQSGKMLSGGGTGTGGAGNSSATDEQTAAFEDRISAKAQEVLDTVVGSGHSVVRVNAKLNFDDITGTSKVYTAPSPSAPPLSEANVDERYNGDGTNTGGILGQILPTAIATSGAAGNGYARVQTTKNNSVNETVTKTDTAPGGVERMTVAVVLDAKTAGGLNTAQVQALIANAVGLDTTRGDTVQVDALPFDTTAAAAAAKALAEANKSAQMAQYLDIGKKAGIALLIVIILFLTVRKRKKDETTIETTASDLPNSGLVLAGHQPAALESGEQLAIGGFENEVSRDRMRDDVAALVDNQPDDVAQMLQGWLAERKS